MRRVFVIVLAGALVLALSGAIYQRLSVRREARLFPPPGRLIPVGGGRSLHLVCLGQGQPTILFEHSALGDASSSRAAREELSAYSTTCSYDRMGMGWSDPGPGVITAGVLVDDLERLTRQAELRAPYILVPASIGGIVAELFARRHAESIAGMVFVDGGNSLIAEAAAAKLNWMETGSACLLPLAAQLGVLRLLDPLGLRKDPSPDAAAAIARLYRAEPMGTLCAIARGARRTIEEFHQAPPLAPDIPLTVLVHERPDGLFPPSFASYGQRVDRQWLEWQQAFARRSHQGTWRIVPGSDHLIGNSQPHAVAAAVLEMLAQIRR